MIEDLMNERNEQNPRLRAAVDKIRELGSTADCIADGLRARGVKGVPKRPGCCPLANYLNGSDLPKPDGCAFTIDYDVNLVKGLFVPPGASEDEIDTFDEMVAWAGLHSEQRDFIRNFDARKYPDLIAE